MSTGGRDGYDSLDEQDLDEIKSELASSADSVEDKLPDRFQYQSAPTSPSRTISQRSNVEFTLLSVRERVSSLENLSNNLTVPSSTMTLKDDLKPLIASRGSYRGKITISLKSLKEFSEANKLNELLLDRQINSVSRLLDKIEEIEMKMSTIYESYAVTLSDTARSEDLTKSIQYVQEVTSTLAGYRQASKPTPVANKSVRNQDLVDALAKNQGAPGRNLVTCGKFDGGNTDAFGFLAWFS